MEMIPKPGIYLSYIPSDKTFAQKIATELKHFGLNVFLDTLEIAEDDSFEEKVFSFLHEKDTLIVIVSKESTASKWLKGDFNEEIAVKLVEKDLTVFSVIKEACELPVSLRGFRSIANTDKNNNIFLLLDLVEPGHRLRESLYFLHAHFCLLLDQLMASTNYNDASNKILTIHALMESALDVRTEIEILRARKITPEQKGEIVSENLKDKKGLINHEPWLSLLPYRSKVAHNMKSHQSYLTMFAYMLKKNYSSDDLKASLNEGMTLLKNTMQKICFERWDTQKRVDEDK